MRRIEAAKNTVPIGIVTLCAKKMIAGLCNFAGRLGFGAALRHRGQSRSGAKHFLVQEIGFRIFAKTPAPCAPSQKRGDFGALGKLLLNGMESLAHASWQSPLSHFGVRGGGQIRAAKRRMSIRVFARRSDTEPIGIHFKRREEIVQPMIVIAMFESAWPHAEFFHVVAKHGNAVGMSGGGLTQVLHDLFDRSERY